jgi:hypothetical protein
VILNLKGVPVKTDNVDNVLLSATTMYFSGIEKLPGYLSSVRENRVPLLYVFSENDRLVDTKVFYEMADMLGAEEDHFSRYTPQGSLDKPCRANDWMKIMAFKSGGHYAFLKHAPTVNQEILALLQKVSDQKGEKPTQDMGPRVSPPVLAPKSQAILRDEDSDSEAVKVRN